MDIEKKIRMAKLNECYGKVLTEYQSEMVRLYYDCDISLSELAEDYGISRQAVRDVLVRAEGILNELESKLTFLERTEELRDSIGGIMEQVDDTVKDALQLLLERLE